MNRWPSGKYVNLLYMYSILGMGSFCFNYCLNSAWRGGDQFVALLRWYGSPGFFDSDFQMKYKITFYSQRGLWTTEQQFSSFFLSPGKMLLKMFLFQKWLGSPFPEDVWASWLLMHWLQLQFTPCEALPSVWIGFAWQYSQAYGHPCCLCTFSYPISSFQST